jgi:hypothetical protein
MTTSAVARFHHIVRDLAKRYAADKGLQTSPIDLPAKFLADEALHFLRAFDAGIVKIGPIGECSLPGVHRATRNPTQPCLIGYLKTKGTIYFPWREYITQVGALARLVLDYGWPLELVALDPRAGQTFDVAAFSSVKKEAHMIVAVETKKTPKELASLLGQMMTASNGRIPATLSKARDGEKKYRGLLVEEPPYFWAVAPSRSVAYSVTYEREHAKLTEISNLPSYNALPTHLFSRT